MKHTKDTSAENTVGACGGGTCAHPVCCHCHKNIRSNGGCDLEAEGRFHRSLAKLGLKSIDLFYLHSPDIKTDIDDTLEGIDALYRAGYSARP